jgi:hypothetical protein
MQRSQEKLVAGIAALIPVAREAFSRQEIKRQFDDVMTSHEVRDARRNASHYAQRFVKNNLGNHKLARKFASRLAPRTSRLPAVAIAAVGVGLAWAYLARRKARQEAGVTTTTPPANESEPALAPAPAPRKAKAAA